MCVLAANEETSPEVYRDRQVDIFNRLLGPDTNSYRYVGNSPTNETDPSGFAEISLDNPPTTDTDKQKQHATSGDYSGTATGGDIASVPAEFTSGDIRGVWAIDASGGDTFVGKHVVPKGPFWTDASAPERVGVLFHAWDSKKGEHTSGPECVRIWANASKDTSDAFVTDDGSIERPRDSFQLPELHKWYADNGSYWRTDDADYYDFESKSTGFASVKLKAGQSFVYEENYAVAILIRYPDGKVSKKPVSEFKYSTLTELSKDQDGKLSVHIVFDYGRVYTDGPVDVVDWSTLKTGKGNAPTYVANIPR